MLNLFENNINTVEPKLNQKANWKNNHGNTTLKSTKLHCTKYFNKQNIFVNILNVYLFCVAVP